MTRRSIATFLFLCIASVLNPSAYAASADSVSAKASASQQKAYFIDILYLQDGKTPVDAKFYFDKIEPIAAKHGLKRVAPGFVVTKVMAGDVQPHLVNVWTVSDPTQTFDGIFNDPDYLENIPTRSATFDMKRSYMFMMAPAGY